MTSIIKLISPDNTSIVGALLEDGSTCNVSVVYEATTQVIDIVYDHDGKSEFLQEYGNIIYIDENGKKWPSPSVIDYSILHGCH